MQDKKQHAEYTKEWRRKNKERVKQYSIDNKERRAVNTRKSQLNIKYGITIETYDKMLKLQNNCCAICDEPRENFRTNFAVDHDYKTNEVRGLLCRKCNLILGYANDNTSILEKAMEYLNSKKGCIS